MKRILLFRGNATEKILRTLRILLLVPILFLCRPQQSAADPLIQGQQRITLEIKEATIQQALVRIQESTRYEFFYRVEDLPAQPLRNYSFSNASIADVMGRLLAETNLEWTDNSGTIVISRKRAADEELITASGRITDENGRPLIGATVASSTGKYASSDANGRFTIQGVARNSLLTVTYIGYEILTTRVTAESNRELVMVPEVVEIDNVVVTGFQTISRERATGSFDIVSGKKLDRPVASADQLLVGQVAGLYMPQDANGNTSGITVRGIGSWGVASPLIVVDGFPYEGNLNSISPTNVQSITVLKDAAASSIWGARAMHGVIVVVTKRAQKNTPLNVEFSANVRVGSKIDVDYWRNMPSSADMIEYQKGIFGKYNYTPFASVVAKNQIPNVLYITNSQAEILYNKFSNGEISEEDMNAGLARLARLDNTSQLHEYILRQSLKRQYNLTFSGGTERMTSYALFTYDNDNGIVRGSNTQKVDFTYRSDMALAKWVDLSVNASVDYGRGESPIISADNVISLAPYDMLLNEDGSYTDLLHSEYYSPAIYGSVPTSLFPYEDWSYNPLREMRSTNSKSEFLSASFQAALKFRIIKGLTFESNFKYYGSTASIESMYDEDSFQTRHTVNTASTWTVVGGTHNIVQNLPSGGMLTQSRSATRDYRWRNQANFDRVFGDHEISFVGGVEIDDLQVETNASPTTYGYDKKYLTVGSLPNGTGSPVEINDWLGTKIDFPYLNSFNHRTQRFFSAYGNVAYTYLGRYTLSGSLRTDAANYITENSKDRYRPFWSVGLGWNIAREGFIESADKVDQLNLRLTYGYNGNSEVGSNSTIPLVTLESSPNPLTGEMQASITSKGNPNLRWERSGILNAGVDFSLFGGRLSGKFDYYRKHGEDLLAFVAIPLFNGEREALFNAAEILNHGLELTLGSRMRIGNRVQWTGNLNFAYNFNKVLKYYRTEHPYWWMTGSGGNTWVEGRNMNSLYSFGYGGMRNVGSESNPKMMPVIMLRDGEYMPFGGSTTLDGKDFLKYQGVTVPPYTLGTTHTFSYRGIDLTFCLTGYFGHVFRRTSFNYAVQGTYPNKMWRDVTGDIDTDKVVPLPEDPTQTMWSRSVFDYLDILTESADNVRLQYLTLDYTLPKQIVSRWKLSRVTVYAQGNNLFTVKATKEDPDYGYGAQRLQASYSFGLKVQF